MIKARGQAERYVRALPTDEPTDSSVAVGLPGSVLKMTTHRKMLLDLVRCDILQRKPEWW